MDDYIDHALGTFLALAALMCTAIVGAIAIAFVFGLAEGQDARNDRRERAIVECHARGGTANVTSYGSLESCTIPPRVRP